MPIGIYNHKKGYHLSKEHRKNLSISHKGTCTGSNHSNWKGGISHKKEYDKEYAKKYRKKNKENIKKYNKLWKQTERGRLSQKRHNLIHRTRTKDLTIKTVQLVYEDNIKKYGTLTCYLCLEPIEFGKDDLEHKIPLCRGGNNEYANLAVACEKCNCKKYNKTVEEYKEVIWTEGHLVRYWMKQWGN